MNELQKIARAQMYMEKLANGVNPLSDEEVGENDVINNVRISRCMFYVSDILKSIVDNKGKFKIEMHDRAPFNISAQQAEQFAFSQEHLSISEITKRFNALIDPIQVKELKLGVITNWLTEVGMLDNVIINDKQRKIPSDKGRAMGINTEERFSKIGTPYTAVVYSIRAQRFIVDNIEAIVAFNAEK